MDKNKIQKVNRALVASTLAAGSVAIIVPSSNTAQAFSDVPTTSDHYSSISQLVNRDIIKGYGDNTFRPNQIVTRGQAAKMIAKSMSLDTTNVKNPGFSDVSTKSEFYPYIAALANKGIINGFMDNTFRPSEGLTRAQIAKILVNGYQFEMASKVDNTFNDVNDKTSQALAIQTLLNLKITKGTTPVTYSPYSHVTRGQLSSLIIRSEGVKSKAPSTYKITGISGSTIYLNSVPYKLASNLKTVFNKDNESVLKGATIEGKITASTVQSVTQLTITASGTSKKMLTFEGDYETLNANILIKGNYIRFQNFDLTGTVTVAETLRKSLKDYTSRLPQNVFASSNNAFGFINWTTTPTNMEEINKEIEFTNTTVAKLIIYNDKTKIASDLTLPNVSIIADVKEIELQANIKKLLLNTDVALTIYGQADIERIDYKSLTDLNLYADGTIANLIVDNLFGWIDLGPDTNVDKVELPKGASPNDTFDDYLVDFENIADITDPDGKWVDKEPIENQQPVDKIAPIITSLSVTSLEGAKAEVNFSVNEGGNYYYIVREKDEDAPSLKEIVTGPGVSNRSGRAYAGTNKFTVSGLKEKTEYTIYLVAVDASNNVSKISDETFLVKDSIAPVVSIVRAAGLYGGQRAEFVFTGTEPGDYYYYIAKDTEAAPTVEGIIANPTGKGTMTTGKLSVTEIAKGLQANTNNYVVYVVMKDTSGNVSKQVVSSLFTTGPLDNVSPYVAGKTTNTDKQLEPYGESQFYIYFSEELEKSTAEDVNNYDLSGTGIINVTGQDVIKPKAAVYEKYGSGKSRVLLTVPSFTGFVNGDTLKVTVLPGVKDLADNEFENINTVATGATVRNIAQYKHDDTVAPILDIEQTFTNTSGAQPKIEVTFNASKAGTYYYMIMPDNTDITTITSRDFVDEFTSMPTGKFDKSPSEKIYLSKSSDAADLGSQKFDITETSTLDPFTTYSVFMVLRDRSGNLSSIVKKQVIDDSIAPDITGLNVKSKTNDDTAATLSFNSTEKGTVYYWYAQKYITDASGNKVLNPDAWDASGNPIVYTADQIKTKGQNKPMNKDVNYIDITGLTRHKEYVMYVAVEDTFGNLTAKMVPTGVTRPVDPNNEVTAQNMIQPFYADGTLPKIKNHIVYRNPDNTFTITFNEAIMRTYDANKNEISEITSATALSSLLDMTGANVSDFAIQSYTVGTTTSDESKLVIKYNGTDTSLLNTTIDVKMKDTTVDQKVNSAIAGNAFDLTDFGKYVYRGLYSQFIEIKLVDKDLVGDNKKVEATFDLTSTGVGQQFESGEEVKYYYLSSSLGTAESVIAAKTPTEVINSVLTGSDASLATGTGTISTDIARVTIPLYHPAKFYTGDWITIVLEDKYGNLKKIYQKVGYIYTP